MFASKKTILTRPRVFMNVDEQKATHVGEGRGSPLVLKPVQRRQHQFVLRSVIFSVTEFQSLVNAFFWEQDFGHWSRDFHLAKTHHIRSCFFSCRWEATHRQVYVFREISVGFKEIRRIGGGRKNFWSIQPAAGGKNIVFSPPQAENFGI